jgi:hypothetical protein
MKLRFLILYSQILCILFLTSCVGTHQEPTLPEKETAVLKLLKMDYIDTKLPYNIMGVMAEPKQIKVMPGEHIIQWQANALEFMNGGLQPKYDPLEIKIHTNAGHVYRMCYALFAIVDGRKMTLDAASAALAKDPELAGLDSEALRISLHGLATPERVRPVVEIKDRAKQAAWNRILSARVQPSILYFAYDETTGEVLATTNEFRTYLKQRALVQAKGNYLQL